MKVNDIILQSVTRIIVFIILTLGFYLFFSGVNAPGGGFIGGLVLAASLILILLAFDIEQLRHGIPVDFKLVGATGALFVLISGLGAIIFGKPFLEHSAKLIKIPILGELELSTVTLFETGVALAVVGVVLTIIISIGEDV